MSKINVTVQNDKPDVLCPECGNKMAKAGMAWSGKNRRQRFRCNKCGRTVIRKQG